MLWLYATPIGRIETAGIGAQRLMGTATIPAHVIFSFPVSERDRAQCAM